MKIDALNDHIIVEVIDTVETKSDGGIILPETVVNLPQKFGKVISVGPKVDDKRVKVGVTLAFAKFGGQDILMHGKSIIKVLKQGEVYGIVSE